jgi:hypothetical protein
MSDRAALALIALTLLIAPETRATDELRGYASAYDVGVMEDVIRTRFDNNWWPVVPARGWYESHGAIAAMDCRRVGTMAVLVDPAGREYNVLIADCAGNDGPADRFSRDNIIAELDAGLFEQLTAEFGRPLEVRIK